MVAVLSESLRSDARLIEKDGEGSGTARFLSTLSMASDADALATLGEAPVLPDGIGTGRPAGGGT